MRTRTDSHEIHLLRRITLVLGGIILSLLVILSLQVRQWRSGHGSIVATDTAETETSHTDTGTEGSTSQRGELTIPPAHAGEIRSDPPASYTTPDSIPDTTPDTTPDSTPSSITAIPPDTETEPASHTSSEPLPDSGSEPATATFPEASASTVPDPIPDTLIEDTLPAPAPETEVVQEGIWQEAQQVSDGMHFEPDPQGGYTLVSVDGGDDRILIVPPLTPDGDPVTGIGPDAFADLSELAVLFLPASLERISANAFVNCSHLVNITIEADCAAYCTSGGLLYDRDRTRLLCCPAALEAEQLLLPGSLLYIEDYALYGVRSVRSIEYEGSSEDWALIDIGRGNNLLSILGVVCRGG